MPEAKGNNGRQFSPTFNSFAKNYESANFLSSFTTEECNKQKFFTFFGLFVGYLTALCGSETRTLGKNEDRIINALEKWCWRRMLKIKWTDKITNGEVFKGRKKKDYLCLLDRASS